MDKFDQMVHNELCEQARGALTAIPKLWKDQRHLSGTVLIWPSEAVEYFGYTTEDSIGFDMPKDRNEWSSFLLNTAVRNKACALLLVEQRAQAIVAIFESIWGTASWHYPIKNHGDTKVLGEPVEKTNTDSIGLLWRPVTGQA